MWGAGCWKLLDASSASPAEVSPAIELRGCKLSLCFALPTRTNVLLPGGNSNQFFATDGKPKLSCSLNHNFIGAMRSASLESLP